MGTELRPATLVFSTARRHKRQPPDDETIEVTKAMIEGVARQVGAHLGQSALIASAMSKGKCARRAGAFSTDGLFTIDSLKSCPAFSSTLLHIRITATRLVASAAAPLFLLDKKAEPLMAGNRLIWTIPASRMKGKNGKARSHSVPLTADIAGLPRFERGEYLFSAKAGERPICAGDRGKRRVDVGLLETFQELAKERGDDPAKVKLRPWVNYDLRRTLRSRLSELRVSPNVAEAIQAHVEPGIRGVYDRYEHFDEKRHALELWATRLRSIVQPQQNVVELALVR
jgi:hypothetical protein